MLFNFFFRGFLRNQPKKYYKLFGQCHPEIGYYEINFFESENKNITVFVDDYIIITEDSEPLFASIKEDNKLVVGICLLIEKAYAKINGSYLNIEGPFQPINTHFYFTGIPSIQYTLKEFENNELYSFIDDEIKEKNVLTTGTPTTKDEEFPFSGIYSNHEYSVISVEEKKKINIITINNPWGCNVKDDMDKFDISLDNEEIRKTIIDFNKKNKNLENGDIKLDIQNYINSFEFITLCPFKQVDEKEQKKGIKKKEPKGFPSNGFDDNEIDEIHLKRKGILDSLNIEKNIQDRFFIKFKNFPELGLYVIFKLFINLGARREVFYKLMEEIDKVDNNTSSQSQQNFSQIMFNLSDSIQNKFKFSK